MKYSWPFLLIFSVYFSSQSYSQDSRPICGDIPINWSYLNLPEDGKLRSSATPLVIKIFIHVVANSDGSNGISTTNIDSIMLKFELMRHFYNPHGICFILGGIDQINNTDLDEHYVDTEESELTPYLKPDMFNIFIHDFLGLSGGGSTGGWAYAIPNPGLYFSVWELAITDPNAMPVFAHELGHCLGLLDTNDTGAGSENVDRSGACKNCETTGDLLCDTPADPRLDLPGMMINCAYAGTTSDVCNVQYSPDPKNIMSYSGGTCQSHFSTGQGARLLSYLTTSPFNTTIAPLNIVFSTTGSWMTGEHYYLAQQNVTLNSVDLSVINSAQVTFSAGNAVTIFPGTTFTPQSGFVLLSAQDVCQP